MTGYVYTTVGDSLSSPTLTTYTLVATDRTQTYRMTYTMPGFEADGAAYAMLKLKQQWDHCRPTPSMTGTGEFERYFDNEPQLYLDNAALRPIQRWRDCSARGTDWRIQFSDGVNQYCWDHNQRCFTPEQVVPPPASQRLRELIAARQAPAVHVRSRPLALPTAARGAPDLREQRARETLRRVIGDGKFKSYLKTGFVSVRAPSGLVYQLFPGHGQTRVWRNGQPVEKLCVVLRDDFPPTDSLIMRYLLVLNNEAMFRATANVSQFEGSTAHAAPRLDLRPLNEILAEMKVAAASRKPVAAACPRDTDGDGNCGRAGCPLCGVAWQRAEAAA